MDDVDIRPSVVHEIGVLFLFLSFGGGGLVGLGRCSIGFWARSLDKFFSFPRRFYFFFSPSYVAQSAGVGKWWEMVCLSCLACSACALLH